ncbi:MAG TPA: glycosyltransferase [Candidatus Ozemobacteraceae bacterium]|nr:glycosyltransferase [Candidatus Ozemobacteraceae bacterium]
MTDKTLIGGPIRILRLLSRMNVGGPSIHVINLTRSLADHGFETRLVVGEPPLIEGSMIPLARQEGIEPRIIAGLTREIDPVRDAAAFAAIVSEIREFRPHIVETHTAKAGLLGRVAAVACGVPVTAHTFHGNVFEGYFSSAGTCGIMFAERILSRLSDLIIALSPGQRKAILDRLRLPKSEKVRVVPLGLDLSSFLHLPRRTGEWRRAAGIPENACLMGLVARLVPVKNHLGLMAAFRRLASEHERLHLAIVGGGELEAELRRWVLASGLAGRIHLTGIVQPIGQVYADLDVLVLTSRNEGTPLVLIEALAAGCPVAATAVGGVPELLSGVNGARLLGIDQETLVSDLRSVLSGLESLQHAAACNRGLMQRRFPIDTLAETMAGLYRGILRRRIRPS